MDDSGDIFNVSFCEDDPAALSCLEDSVISIDKSIDSVNSFESLPSQLPSTSTPRKGIQDATLRSSALFKVPAEPSHSFAKCVQCGRGLTTERGLKNHMLAHKWKEVAARKPSHEDVLLHCSEASKLVLVEMVSAPCDGQWGSDFNAFVQEVATQQNSIGWSNFVSKVSSFIAESVTGVGLPTNGVTFTSALRHQIQRRISIAFSDKEFINELLDCVMMVRVMLKVVAHPFVLEFIRRLSNSALTFIFKSLSGRLENYDDARHVRSKDDFDHHMSHQVVHYIAGACMRTHLRHACRYPRNGRLHRIKNLILSKFTTSGSCSVAQPQDKSYWTSLMNRKALLFVNEEAFPFFLEVAKVLQHMEKPDGGFGHEAVVERIVRAPFILAKWDNIVASVLNEDESFEFMVKVVKTLTNTYGRGVLLRRMNRRWKQGKGNKATVSVSHRARLL